MDRRAERQAFLDDYADVCKRHNMIITEGAAWEPRICDIDGLPNEVKRSLKGKVRVDDHLRELERQEMLGEYWNGDEEESG